MPSRLTPVGTWVQYHAYPGAPAQPGPVQSMHEDGAADILITDASGLNPRTVYAVPCGKREVGPYYLTSHSDGSTDTRYG